SYAGQFRRSRPDRSVRLRRDGRQGAPSGTRATAPGGRPEPPRRCQRSAARRGRGAAGAARSACPRLRGRSLSRLDAARSESRAILVALALPPDDAAPPAKARGPGLALRTGLPRADGRVAPSSLRTDGAFDIAGAGARVAAIAASGVPDLLL